MDFKIAEQRMVNALTLQEKTLAKEFSESATFDKASSSVYLRSPIIALDDWRGKAKIHGIDLGEGQSVGLIRRLYLYCDTLEVPENFLFGDVDLSYKMDLTIFARKIRCLGNPENAMQMDFTEDVQLEIFSYALPSEEFCIHFRKARETWVKQKLSIGKENWGVRVNTQGDGELLIEQCELDDLDMSTANYLDRLNENGTLKDDGEFINDNLARLVHYQFLVAASIMHVDRKLALEILHWVCNLTASESSRALNVQACSLRHGLILSTTRGVFNVPSVNIYASKQVLKARLIAAKAYEDAFQNFAAQDQTSKNFAGQAADLLAKSHEAISEYAFLEDIAQHAYVSALTAYQIAEKRFREEQKGLNALEIIFNQGLDAWAENQKIEAVKQTFFACLEVAGAIVATVATAGVAAPAAAVVGVEAAQVGSKIAAMIKRLIEIVEKIKELYEKLEPVISKIMDLVEKVQGLVQAMQEDDTLRAERTIQRPDTSLDIYNATATWDIFKEQVDSMEKELAEVNSAGKTEYFLHLRTLIIDGKTYLQTHENLIQRGNELSVILMKTKMGQKDKDRLESSLSSMEKQTAVYDILKRAMFDRLLTIRSLVFFDFNTYSDAYMFHTLTSYPPITISPVKPIVDYLEDAAKFQGNVADFGSRVMVQQRRFIIRTIGEARDVAELRKGLQTTGKITASFHPSHGVFKGFCRVRVGKARCYLEGVRPATASNLSALCLYLRTSGRFYDIDLPGHRNKDTAPVWKAFVGDPRSLLFEYSLEDSSIICDGEYSSQRDYTRQTPITDWEVAIAPGGLQVKDLDLDGLTGLRFEFWCDVTLVGA